MFRTNFFRENPKTHFVFNILYFVYLPVYEIIGTYCRGRQATDDNMAHARCIPAT